MMMMILKVLYPQKAFYLVNEEVKITSRLFPILAESSVPFETETN